MRIIAFSLLVTGPATFPWVRFTPWAWSSVEARISGVLWSPMRRSLHGGRDALCSAAANVSPGLDPPTRKHLKKERDALSRKDCGPYDVSVEFSIWCRTDKRTLKQYDCLLRNIITFYFFALNNWPFHHIIHIYI